MVSICSFALVLGMLAGSAGGVPRAWTGAVDSDWFIDGNWDPSGVPAAGDTVTVAAAARGVVLTNATPRLASFTLSAQTLTMSNWLTRIEADAVTIVNEGIMTLPPPFTAGDPSNRIWIVCDDFLLASGGEIRADSRGYAALSGPGAASGTSRGAGYGGVGIAGYWTGTVGPAYGVPESPGAPGSGGANGEGGHSGGGAVRIDASSSLRVDGAIQADGGSGRGSGSGGAIWLSTGTLSGSNGVLWARGGSGANASDGTGGGGRIALHFASIGSWHGMRLSARHGTGGNPGYFPLVHSGSIYVSSLVLLTRQQAGALLAGIEGRIHAGDTLWHTVDVTCNQGFFGLASNLNVQVDGNLTLGDGSSIWSLEGANEVRIGGDLVLRPGGRLHARGGPTNALDRLYGGLIDVAGTVDIASNAWLYSVSEPANGGAVFIRAGAMRLRAGGGIDASRRGFGSMLGPGRPTGSAGGGSHGGLGGSGGWGANPGPIYGHPYLPIDAGSGSGAGHGGGLVRIEVAGRLQIDGLIAADGVDYNGNSGAGSGGSIWIVAGRFYGATSGRLSACGGLGGGLAGGGGGGRIAVWQPRMASDFIARVATGYLPAAGDYSVSPPGWSGQVSVAGGEQDTAGREGKPGSIFFCSIPIGSVISLR